MKQKSRNSEFKNEAGQLWTCLTMGRYLGIFRMIHTLFDEARIFAENIAPPMSLIKICLSAKPRNK